MNGLDNIIEECESDSDTNTSNPSTAAQSTSTIWQRLEKREHNTNVSINQIVEHIFYKYFELIIIIDDFFGDRVISNDLWPPRSPDFFPMGVSKRSCLYEFSNDIIWAKM